MRVYIAGPYTRGDVAVNVRTAILAGQRVLDAGHFPYIPHLTHFWHLLLPGSYERWIAMDLEWVRACHALVRLPGDSPGADGEVAHAQAHGIPVFMGVEAWQTWLGTR